MSTATYFLPGEWRILVCVVSEGIVLNVTDGVRELSGDKHAADSPGSTMGPIVGKVQEHPTSHLIQPTGPDRTSLAKASSSTIGKGP